MKKRQSIACASLLAFALGYAVSGALGAERAEAASARKAAELLDDREFRDAVGRIARQEIRRALKNCRINGYVEGANVLGFLDC